MDNEKQLRYTTIALVACFFWIGYLYTQITEHKQTNDSLVYQAEIVDERITEAKNCLYDNCDYDELQYYIDELHYNF